MSEFTADELRVVERWLSSELVDERLFQEEVVDRIRRKPWSWSAWRDGLASAFVSGVMSSVHDCVRELIPIYENTDRIIRLNANLAWVNAHWNDIVAGVEAGNVAARELFVQFTRQGWADTPEQCAVLDRLVQAYKQTVQSAADGEA